MMARGIVLAAGGTGGHVFPAEALAAELRAAGHELALVTDVRGIAYGGALAGIDVHRIPAGTPGVGGPLRRARGVLLAVAGTLRAVRLLRRLKPVAVVGFGGYPSLPTMLAALWLRIPTLVHEQNAVLGRVNRLLVPWVTRVGLSFSATGRLDDAAQPKAEVVGNPVRPEVLAIRAGGYAPPSADGPIRLLVLGGSQGAAVFSEVVPSALALLPAELRARLKLAQQCRPETLAAARAICDAAGIDAELAPFFGDVPARLAVAHLVICRAGASTVAELKAAGRPAVLVPYPHAVDDHQTANARSVAGAGGGWIVPQSEFTPARLAELLRRLFAHPDDLDRAAEQCRGEDRPEAARALAALVENLVAPRVRVVPAAAMGAARGRRVSE
ncbi:MAG: undecaprenyldiphospho-muramoylpentapeptide beta-N-acetylglucosaminyltransferase [Proteobacteria bacterium]|nr:undecaprenyldiphospho-muramoylpentapeptide beta-N-acetylglucosaminyltransferase [Pseudomonadota bacterium]